MIYGIEALIQIETHINPLSRIAGTAMMSLNSDWGLINNRTEFGSPGPWPPDRRDERCMWMGGT